MLTETPQALIDSLKILEKLDSCLPARALSYVMTGEPLLVLNDFSGKGSASELAGAPGRLYYGYYAWSVEKVVRKLIKTSLKARHQFYALLGTESAPDLTVYVRFGKLLEAIDQGQSLQRIAVPGLPKWFQYLANDSLHACMCWNSTPLDESSRGAWTLSLMHELLASEGLDGNLALRHAFERKGIAEDQHINLDWLLRDSSLNAYVERYGEAFNLLPEKLSSAGRCLLVRVIADNDLLLQQHVEVLIALLLDKNKQVRGKASRRVERINSGIACQLLAQKLNNGPMAQRKLAAEALGLHFAQHGRAILENALEQTNNIDLQPVIQAALLRLEAAHSAEVLPPPTPIGYQALPDSKLGERAYQILQQNRIELLEEYRLQAEQEIEANKNIDEPRFKSSWRQAQYADYQQFDDSELVLAINTLNDNSNPNSLTNLQIMTIVYHSRIFELAELSFYHIVRLLQGTRYYKLSYFWHEEYFQRWLLQQNINEIDLRALAEASEKIGLGRGVIAGACLCSHHNELKPWDQLSSARIWAFFAQYPDLIEEGLGIRPKKPERYHEFDVAMTLETLKIFPYIPPLFVPRLMELALGESPTYRESAQKLLLCLPDIGRQVTEALTLPKQETRVTAIKWLLQMNCRTAIPALYQALKREKRETVRAEILNALEQMGEAIESLLLPEALKTEAEEGLKGRLPSGISWLPFEELPNCYWQRNNAQVDAKIIKWWVILACKFKSSKENALVNRYLSLLNHPSRLELGRFILHQFVKYDLRHPSLAEAESFARTNVEQRYQYYQESAKRWPEHYLAQGRMSMQQVFDELLHEKQTEYVGTAIGEKGILALAFEVPSDDIVQVIRTYLDEHYQRRAQIEALLELLVRKNDETATKLLHSIAQRYRTSSVQNKARDLLANNFTDKNQLSKLI